MIYILLLIQSLALCYLIYWINNVEKRIDVIWKEVLKSKIRMICIIESLDDSQMKRYVEEMNKRVHIYNSIDKGGFDE